MPKLLVEVCLSPRLYPSYHREEGIVVIIDIFRATSAICTAFQYGVHKMIPVASVEEARRYKEKGFLVGAERDGIPLEGFDFGNSPYNYMTEKIRNQTVVITTTNGTQAIEAARHAKQVVIGSFLNITALTNWLQSQESEVILLCSGWKNRFSMEDTLFAGAVADRLSASNLPYLLGDAALAAKYMYQAAQKNPYRLLHESSHKKRLHALGLKEDIKYCLSLDRTSIIPILEGDSLVAMSS
ncbi:MAG: 2-phosphosulfolactate phosphatase [Bacteroidia bacterium]